MMRIRDLRKARGLTQEQLAEKAGLSRSHLSEIETGAAPPNTLRLEAIARALRVTTAELFGGDASLPRDDLAEVYARLSQEHKAMVLHHARALAALDDRRLDDMDPAAE